jgi:hypothetical protein
MKPAQEVDGPLAAVRHIVIGAVIGGSIGVAAGWWLYQGSRPAFGPVTGLLVPIRLFTVLIGTCIGAAFGVVVAERRAGMRQPQRFRPGASLSLEGRIALSSFAHTASAEHAIVAQATPVQSILNFFPVEAPGLAAGNPVYERRTIAYYDGLSETDNETFVLNDQTVTLTEKITLPGTEGTESAVDHYTAIAGGVLFQNTFTEPNGQVETETRTDTFEPHDTVLRNGSIQRPDGVNIAFTSRSVGHGAKTVINQSFHESNGITYTTHEVDVNRGQGITTATVTTKWPDGSHQVDKSTSSVVLLSSPPS